MTLAAVPAASVVLGRQVGAGGEAEVFDVVGRRDVVFKRYRHPEPERDRKLRVMVGEPPEAAGRTHGHVTIAWPIELVETPAGTVEGFLMPRVDPASTLPLFQLYNPQSRRQVAPGFTWRYLVRTARNVAAIVDTIHRAGHVVGDLNESNLLVTRQALATLVDCDSIQVRHPDGSVLRCRVAKAEFLAPELRGRDLGAVDRTEHSDAFALAVLVHLLLREGVHPFAGVWRGKGHESPPELADRIAAGAYPGRWPRRQDPPPYAVPGDVLPRRLRKLTWQAFVTGSRRPRARPAPSDWVEALSDLESSLRECRRSPHHVYSGHRRRCPWCERMSLGLPDPFPAPGGEPLAPPPVPVAVRVRRTAASVVRRTAVTAGGSVLAAGRWAARPALVVAATGALLWWVPALALAAAVLVVPAVQGARAVDPPAPPDGRLRRAIALPRRGWLRTRAAAGAIAGSVRRLPLSAGIAVGVGAAVLAVVVLTGVAAPSAIAEGWPTGARVLAVLTTLAHTARLVGLPEIPQQLHRKSTQTGSR